jgi:hypothetical protein
MPMLMMLCSSFSGSNTRGVTFSLEKPYRKVVDNLIILLVLKFDSHKFDRLGVMLFTNSVTESVQILYRFQKLHCLLKLIL